MLTHIPAQPPRSHTLHLYDADAVLLHDVTGFIRTTLGTGACALVVATPSHQRDINARLQAIGVDMDQVRREGRYLSLDAASTLDLFMEGDRLNEARFASVIGDLLRRAKGRSHNAQHPVGVFGEMVALLASQGRHAAAIRLEEAWNGIARTHPFSLQCGYPTSAFTQSGGAEALATICATHTHVVPAESYSALDGESRRLRVISPRQHDALTIEHGPFGHDHPPRRVILHPLRPGHATAVARSFPVGHEVGRDEPALRLDAGEIIRGLHAVIGMHGLPLAVRAEEEGVVVACHDSPSWELVIQPGAVPLAVAYRGRLPERRRGARDDWAPLWALLASWGTKQEQLRPAVSLSRFFPEFLDHLL